MTRARVADDGQLPKIDDYTVAITTKKPASYFPYMAVYMLFTSPAQFEKAGRDWGRSRSCRPRAPGRSGSRKIVPREAAELARNDGYWDTARKAKLDKMVLMPMPEANARLAALRSGQVDWIEVPPPDAICRR